MDKYRQVKAFGSDVAYLHTEPVGLWLRASIAVGELVDAGVAAMDDDADEDARADARNRFLYGKGAVALARASGYSGDLAVAVMSNPLAQYEQANATVEELARIIRNDDPQAAGSFLSGFRERFMQVKAAHTPEEQQDCLREAIDWANREAVKILNLSPRPASKGDMENYTHGMEAAVVSSGRPFGGLNRVLYDVSMRVEYRDGRWISRYSPPTLWAALHVELANRIVFGSAAPARCAGCGAGYWQRTSGRRHARQRFAPGHHACRQRISRAERKETGEHPAPSDD